MANAANTTSTTARLMNLPAIGSVMQVASGLRFHEVQDDHLGPAVRPRDFVLLAPVSEYAGEGYYLVSDHLGGAMLYCCQPAGHPHPRKSISLRIPNPDCRGGGYVLSFDDFNDAVLGKVAMTCKVVEQKILRAGVAHLTA